MDPAAKSSDNVAIEGEVSASADKNINDVLNSVQEEFAAVGDGGVHVDTDGIGSLQLSETQSQSTNCTAPVTQPEDVPAQLQAEKERKERKVQLAFERKIASKQDKSPGGSVQNDVPRRSPRVAAFESGVEGRTSQSPRPIAHSKASPSPAKRVRNAVGKVKKSKLNVDMAKEVAPGSKKFPCKGKQAAKVNQASKEKLTEPARTAKKLKSTSKKSVHFDKDEEHECDHEADNFENASSGDDFDVSQYEFAPRTGKRNRNEDVPPGSCTADPRRFNTLARCSLKEIALCIALLKDRHLTVLKNAGLGHLKDYTIKSNINRRLICFLMYRIDPKTMTMDLGDPNKVLKITAEGIQLLYGLPRGKKTPPRPSDDFHSKALINLKDELGVPRNKDIKTDDLRKMLASVVNDQSKDAIALKIFGLILYNKFICPGYGIRITREATMVEDFDLANLSNVDLCQLLHDELRRAVYAWQAAGADWRAIPGCCITPLLMYLDCVDHRLAKGMNMSTPRALFVDPSLLRKLADKDLITRGSEKPESWIYGKLPWKSPNDIIYNKHISASAVTHTCVSPQKRIGSPSCANVHSPKRPTAGSASASAGNYDGSSANVFEAVFQQLDTALSRACELSIQLPITSVRLRNTAGLLPAGRAFNEEAENVALSAEAANLDHLQKSVSHLRQSFVMFKTLQDARCKPYEDDAKLYIEEMRSIDEAAADKGSHDDVVLTNEKVNIEGHIPSPRSAAKAPSPVPVTLPEEDHPTDRDGERTLFDSERLEEGDVEKPVDAAVHAKAVEDDADATSDQFGAQAEPDIQSFATGVMPAAPAQTDSSVLGDIPAAAAADDVEALEYHDAEDVFAKPSHDIPAGNAADLRKSNPPGAAADEVMVDPSSSAEEGKIP